MVPPGPTTGPFWIGSPQSLTDIYGFCGKLDEVQIYNRVLPPELVRDVLYSTATAMHMPLDEAPGASTFADTSLAHRASACASATCPTAGTAGRVNQAASFNTGAGHTNDVLPFANTPVNQFNDRLSVAAWIKLDKVAAGQVQRIVSTGRKTTPNDGWSFGVSGSELVFTPYSATTASYTSSGAGLQAGRWYHVAAVMDGTSLILYQDGAQVGSTTVHHTTADTADQLLIGAAPEQCGGDRRAVPRGDRRPVYVPHGAAPFPHSRNSTIKRLPHTSAWTTHSEARPSSPNNAETRRLPALAQGTTCPPHGEGVKRPGRAGSPVRRQERRGHFFLPTFGAFNPPHSLGASVSATERHGGPASGSFRTRTQQLRLCSLKHEQKRRQEPLPPASFVRVQAASGAISWQYAESTTSRSSRRAGRKTWLVRTTGRPSVCTRTAARRPARRGRGQDGAVRRGRPRGGRPGLEQDGRASRPDRRGASLRRRPRAGQSTTTTCTRTAGSRTGRAAN